MNIWSVIRAKINRIILGASFSRKSILLIKYFTLIFFNNKSLISFWIDVTVKRKKKHIKSLFSSAYNKFTISFLENENSYKKIITFYIFDVFLHEGSLFFNILKYFKFYFREKLKSSNRVVSLI